MIDVRQGVTNFENTTAGPASIAAAFDDALGPDGYYGIFGSHYDMTDTYNQTLFSVAKSRNVPIISAQQALTWLDGRSSSNFSNLKSLGSGKESFTITAAEGSTGLQAMLPISDAGGAIASIQTGGQTVTYQTETIKGGQYAVFAAQPGDYVVTYSDYTAPVAVIPTVTSTPANTKDTSKSGTPEADASTTAETAAATVPTNTQSPISIKPLTQAIVPVTTKSSKSESNPLVTAATVVGVATVVVGGGAGIWIAAKRYRQK
jgi:hypothetical protein